MTKQKKIQCCRLYCDWNFCTLLWTSWLVKWEDLKYVKSDSYQNMEDNVTLWEDYFIGYSYEPLNRVKRLSAVSLQKLLLVGFSTGVQPVFILKYMLWLNIFLCFKLIVIHYHAHKETEMKVKPMTYWAAIYTHVNIVPINSAPDGIWILVSSIISPTRWF